MAFNLFFFFYAKGGTAMAAPAAPVATALYSGTSRNQAYKQQYQRLQRDTGMKYKKGFFFKTLRSEVMASFTHLE